MKVVKAGNFKAKCLALLDEVAQTHDTIIVTKHGKPVAKVVPFEDEIDKSQKLLKGSVVYMGDVISPVDEPWEAEKN